MTVRLLFLMSLLWGIGFNAEASETNVCERSSLMREQLESVLAKNCADMTFLDLYWLKELTFMHVGGEFKNGDFDGLYQLNKLYILDKSDNGITSLPEDLFRNLDKLENLFLGISGPLPENIFQGLRSLESLRLNSGYTSFPSGLLRGLTSLKDLSMRGINVKEFPVGFLNGLRNLRELWVDAYDLQTLRSDFLKDLRSLESLKLSQLGSVAADIPAGFLKGMHNLRDLEIYYSSDLSPKENSSELVVDSELLESVSIVRSNIPRLTSNYFKNNPYLTGIGIRSSKITTVESDTFKSLKDVEYINLPYNEIKEIPLDAFEGLEKLKGVNLYENPIDRTNILQLRARYPKVNFYFLD